MWKGCFAVVVCALAACSESRGEEARDASQDTGVTPQDNGSMPQDNGPPPPPTDAGAPTDTGAPTDQGTPGMARLVVNEMRASGDDWVELYNAGDAPIDLGGYGVADTEADGGAPRTSLAVRFPTGTTLGPGQYLFILADVADAGAGAQTSCLADSGIARCYHAGWAISASRGETLSVIDARDNVVVRVTYPPNAAPSGQSWGRLPNGTGEFAANRPTPGASNQAP